MSKWTDQLRDFTATVQGGELPQRYHTINGLAAANEMAAREGRIRGLTGTIVALMHDVEDSDGACTGFFEVCRHRPRRHEYDHLGIFITVVLAEPEPKPEPAPAFQTRMMPGQTPYTATEQAQVLALMNDAIDGDPGEEGEGDPAMRTRMATARLARLNQRRAAIEAGLGLPSYSLPLAVSDSRRYIEALVVPMHVLEQMVAQINEIREALTKGVTQGVYSEVAK